MSKTTNRLSIALELLACIISVACTAEQTEPATRAARISEISQALTLGGPYANYSGFEGKRAQEMSISYNVTSDASGPSATYFVSSQVDMVNAAGVTVNGGYIGLQAYSPVTGGHTAVFSIFGGTTSGTRADGTPCLDDADGGPGHSCLIPFNYLPNTNYVMKIQHVGGGVYKGWIDTTLIGTITFPGTVALGNYVVQWLEPYAGTKECDSAPYFKATLGVPVFVPAVTLTHTSHTYGTGYCYNVLQVHNPNSHTFEIGTPPTPIGIGLKSKGSANFVYAVSSSEGCGGGALKNDGATFTKCARITEVDRGGGNVLLQTENGRRIGCSASGAVNADQRSIAVTWSKSLGADGFYSYRSGTKYLGRSASTLTCSATAIGDAQRFFRVVAPPPNSYRLRNAWLGSYLVDVGLGTAYYASASSDAFASHWSLEPWGAAQKRFKNRQTGLYLNNETTPVDASGNRVVATSAVPESAYSGAWTLEDLGSSIYRLQNFWTNEYITVEKQLGYADLNTPAPGWLSAQWLFEPVVPSENKALMATATGSTQASGQEFSKAKDGVADGYPSAPSKEWVSLGEGPSAFIQYNWPTAQVINSVSLSDRVNLNDQVVSGTLSFSDGSSVAVGTLPNNGAASTVPFTTKSVSWVRFTVNSVSASTANIGLAEFEVH